MRKLPPLRMPPTQRFFRVGPFQGLYDLIDPSLEPDNWLVSCENLRFDREAARPRNGLTVYGAGGSALPGVAPITGIGVAKSPAGADPSISGYRHLVVYTQKTDGDAVNRGAIFADILGDGTVWDDLTPRDSNGHSKFIGTGRDMYFSQFMGKLYGVNGRDLLYSWEPLSGNSIQVVTPGPVAFPSSALPSQAYGSLLPNGGWVFTKNPAFTNITVTTYDITTAYQNQAHPQVSPTVGVDQTIQFHVTSEAQTQWAYMKFAQPLDLTGGAFASDRLSVVYQYVGAVSNLAGANVEIHLGTITPGDPTTDPANLAWVPKASNDLFCSLISGGSVTWSTNFLELATAPSAMLSKIQYLAIRVVQRTIPAPVPYDIFIGSLCCTGNLPVGNCWYLLQGFNSLTGQKSPMVFGVDAGSQPPAPVSVKTFDWQPVVQNTPSFNLPKDNFCRKVALTLDFSNLVGADTIIVFRAIQDPANPVPPLTDYREITAFQKPAVGSTVLFYDNWSDDNLNGTPVSANFQFYGTDINGNHVLPYALGALGNPLDTLSAPAPKDNRDAFWFLCPSTTRMFYFRTDNHPSRGWASNLSSPEQVPDFDRQNLVPTDAGIGGFVDFAPDDGDAIMGVIQRQGNERLVFKRNTVWAWAILGEGQTNEKWSVEPVCQPGCVAPRSICRLPNGTVWFAEDGLYFLPHARDFITAGNAANVISAMPVSLPIQHTIDAIPVAQRNLVACAWDSRNNFLLMAIPEGVAAAQAITGATNATPIVLTVADTSKMKSGAQWTVAGVGGNTAANGTFAITVLTSTTLSLNGSAGNGAYTSGGTIQQVPTNTAIMVCDLRRSSKAHPLGIWCAKYVKRDLLKTPSVPLRPSILFSDWIDGGRNDVYVVRGNLETGAVGYVDRFLQTGFDAKPYQDYGTAPSLSDSDPIAWNWATGFVYALRWRRWPLPGRKFRAIRHEVEFVCDPAASPPPTGSATLSLTVRPYGTTTQQLFTIDSTKLINGIYRSGKGTDLDSMADPRTEGSDIQLSMTGQQDIGFATDLRLRDVYLACLDLGEWQG